MGSLISLLQQERSLSVKRFIIASALVTLVLLSAAGARADLIHWSYNWAPNAPAVMADSGSGKITLSNEPAGSAVGDSDIVATNLKAVSSADPTTPDTFTHKGFTLNLTLTDAASHQSGTLAFSAEFNGSISSGSSNITATPLGATSKAIVLGGNLYSVVINSYVPPPPPGATNFGSIGATALVTVGKPSSTPEPSTLALAGFGVSLLGLIGWRKLRLDRELGLAAV
jgi:hypothetical protein